MITGVHAIVFSQQAEAIRAFFRDRIGWPAVDAGEGWLVFALPPAELGVHPTESAPAHRLYLMCDDLEGTMAELAARGVTFGAPPADQGWGRVTAIRLPDGSELGLYQPKHRTAIAAARRA